MWLPEPAPAVPAVGGDGKGQEFAPLVTPLAAYARSVALIGRDAERETPLANVFNVGDAVRLSCDFDTTTRTDPVHFGERTTDEMCLVGFYVTR